MIKSILLSIDGSVYTESAIKTGIHLAEKFDAHLHVLSVIDVRTFDWAMSGANAFAPIIPSSAYLEENKNFQSDKAKAILEKSEELLKMASIKYTLEIASGAPADVICEHERTADLVIMGASGDFTEDQSKIIGENLEAVTRQTFKPLLIVAKAFRPIKSILAAYDGGQLANKGIALAGYFARRLDIPVTVLTASTNEEEASSLLHEAQKYLNYYNIEFKLLHLDGQAETIIHDYANANDMDLIFMGAYGRSRIREAILGSTTQTVIQNAQMPVLLAK